MRSMIICMEAIIFLYQLHIVYETILHHGHVSFPTAKKWVFLGIALFMVLFVIPDEWHIVGFACTLVICMLQKQHRNQLFMHGVLLGSFCISFLSFLALSKAGAVSPFMNFLICMMLAWIMQLLVLMHSDEACDQTYGSLIMIMIISYLFIITMTAQGMSTHVSLIYGLLYLMMICGYRIMYCLERRSVDEKNALTLQYERMGNQDRYETIQKENEVIMRSVHDMKKQLELLQHIDHEELSQYRKELQERTESILLNQKSGDPLLDQVLPLYHVKFQKHHIQFQLECDTISYSFMDPVDLCALLCNLLDNAYQSCIHCKEPFILCKMQRQDRQIIWKMKNSMQVEQEHIERIGHGFGLGNIKTIAQSYGGDFTYEKDLIHGVFTSILYLKDHH